MRSSTATLIVAIIAFGSVPANAEVAPGSELIEHVTYLASPELKGRKPMTRGSKKARTYIAEHFASLGLVPWGDAAGFEQSVLMGTNVVGVLPGGDPTLKEEIVLISAHYDHLGKGHLGAADNAAGVAALLELASRLATAPEPPKRSIAFAAFDCEERGLWGSVCFSVRDDFDVKQFAVNINIDLLGRKAFDVMEDVLFVAVSHAMPPVDAALESAPAIDVLPVPSHLAAARSDHAVFEALGIPALFFSSGLYGDYHQKEDTLENLDFGLLARSADAIYASALAAANAPMLESRAIPLEGTDAMLASVARVQRAMLEKAAEFSLEGETLAAYQTLLADTEAHLLGETCDSGEHASLITRGVTTLGPVMLEYQDAIFREGPDECHDTQEDKDKALERGRQNSIGLFLMAQHGKAYFELYREYARQVLSRSRLSLVTVGLPTYSETRFPLREVDYRLEVKGDEVCRLAAVVPRVSFEVRPHRLVRMLPTGSLSAGTEYLEFDGSREELIDYLLFKWRQGQHRDEMGAAYAKLLREAAGEPVPAKYVEFLAWRMKRLDVKEESEWLDHLSRSDRCDILGPLIVYSPTIRKKHDSLIHIARSANICPAVRATALNWYVDIDIQNGTFSATSEILSNLAALVEDSSVALHTEERTNWDSVAILGPLMQSFNQTSAPPAKDGDKTPPTIGELAHLRLRELTGATEVAKTQAAWRSWLNAKFTSQPDGSFLPVTRKLSIQNGHMEMKRLGGRYVLWSHYSGSGSSARAHSTIWQEGPQPGGGKFMQSLIRESSSNMRASRR